MITLLDILHDTEKKTLILFTNTCRYYYIPLPLLLVIIIIIITIIIIIIIITIEVVKYMAYY